MAIESTRDDKNQQPPYYGDISEDDTIIDLTDELDFNDTWQTFDVDKIIPNENNNEPQDVVWVETDINNHSDNIEAL